MDKDAIKIPEFKPTTFDNKPITRIEEIFGLVDTVTTVPTGLPRSFRQQIKLHYNASTTTTRLYIYDTLNNAWKYVALT